METKSQELIDANNPMLEALVKNIKSETDAGKSVDQLADLLIAYYGTMATGMNKINESVVVLSTAVMGNGKPKESIVFKLARVEGYCKVLFWVFGIVLGSLLGWAAVEIFKLI
jgi:hypothetical protein